jgi:8-oxo-dGTP pyrophosphatase MutT (NUDIX family)
LDNDGKILVGEKSNFYPKGISRLLGGGIKEGEQPLQAAIRELKEETGIKTSKNNLIPLGKVAVLATDEKGCKFEMITHLFTFKLANSTPVPGDDVTKIVRLTQDEFRKLIEKLNNLDDNLWYEGVEGNFSWRDYGKIYAFIHQVALDQIKKFS